MIGDVENFTQIKLNEYFASYVFYNASAIADNLSTELIL